MPENIHAICRLNNGFAGAWQEPSAAQCDVGAFKILFLLRRARYSTDMLKTGILNPHVLNLLARVRHTNTLVIADRGFPFWPQIETVDLSLMDDVPTVLQVLAALRAHAIFGKAWMANEFLRGNGQPTQKRFRAALEGVSLKFEPHVKFKQRVRHAIGLIRTGDTTQYANVILESA
jgi:D-ribose pyranase